MLRYGSVCSGIEAASVAWHPLGWRPAWFAEIEPFPSAVLAHRFPDVPNLGDMTSIAGAALAEEVETVDVLVGGTPCQAFSLAGLREGLADTRGQLTLSFVGLANANDLIRARRGEAPAVILWENVPGVLSSRDNAFGCFLGAMVGEDCPLDPPGGKWSNAGCVYGPTRTVAWRVLDAQYFGVAQRRRRVFVVASARKGFDPASVLFEREGLRRDTAPRREAGPRIANRIANSLRASGEQTGGNRAPGVGGALAEAYAAPVAHSLRAEGFDASEDGTGRGIPLVPIAFSCKDYGADATDTGVTPTLRAMGFTGSHANAGGQMAVAYDMQNDALNANVFGTLQAEGQQAGNRGHGLLQGWAVRRLTVTECERLQGFPDFWTDVPYRGKPAADGPRYKPLGNSMAVPCMAWIGQRIAAAISHAAAE